MDNDFVRDLRQLILGLEEADGDVLKTASLMEDVGRKAKFWWQKKVDPQLKKVDEQLRHTEEQIDQQGQALKQQIKEVKKHHRALDFEGAAQATQKVQEIAKEMLPQAEKAQAEVIEVSHRAMGRRHYSAQEQKEEEIRREMIDASPDYVQDLYNRTRKNGDVPVQDTMLNALFIDAKDTPLQNFLNRVRSAVMSRSMNIGRDVNSLGNQIDGHWQEIVESLKNSIRNGKVEWYDIADVSQEVPNRPVRQMRVIVGSAPEILIPGDTPEENIYVKPGKIWLTHMVDVGHLSLMGVNSITMTGYQPPKRPEPTSTEEEPVIANRSWKLRKLGTEEYLKDKAQDGPIVKAVKRAILREKLPTSRVLVSVGDTAPFEHRVRYAQVLSTALRVELDADCSIHSSLEKIEVEADLSGSQDLARDAVAAISSGVTEAFELSSGMNVQTHVYPGIKSKYALIEPDVMETSFRKVAVSNWSR